MAYNSAKKDNHLIEMSFPPLAALLLTHFDDTQGQSVVFYASVDDHGEPCTSINDHGALFSKEWSRYPVDGVADNAAQLCLQMGSSIRPSLRDCTPFRRTMY